jgi:hypothetical protein
LKDDTGRGVHLAQGGKNRAASQNHGVPSQWPHADDDTSHARVRFERPSRSLGTTGDRGVLRFRERDPFPLGTGHGEDQLLVGTVIRVAHLVHDHRALKLFKEGAEGAEVVGARELGESFTHRGQGDEPAFIDLEVGPDEWIRASGDQW